MSDMPDADALDDRLARIEAALLTVAYAIRTADKGSLTDAQRDHVLDYLDAVQKNLLPR